MADLIVKAHDTFPPCVSTLTQNGQLIDLSTATNIKFIMKSGATLVTGTATKLTVVTPTGTTATGSNVLTSVSSFTNVVIGGSITGAGIPVGARVGAFDSVAGTITVTDAQGNAVNATASASGVALTINKGSVSYSWGVSDLNVTGNYAVEHEITWPSGTQTVPNSAVANQTIEVDADLENS